MVKCHDADFSETLTQGGFNIRSVKACNIAAGKLKPTSRLKAAGSYVG